MVGFNPGRGPEGVIRGKKIEEERKKIEEERKRREEERKRREEERKRREEETEIARVIGKYTRVMEEIKKWLRTLQQQLTPEQQQPEQQPTAEVETSTVKEYFRRISEIAKKTGIEGVRARIGLEILKEIIPTLWNLKGKIGEIIGRLKDIKDIEEKRKTGTLHIEDTSGLYELGSIEGRIKETRNFIETIRQSIDKFFDKIIDIVRKREDQIKNLKESLKEGRLSQEGFKKKLKELEDKLNESLNKIKRELGEIEGVLRKRLMALKVLEEKLGISEPEEKEKKEKRRIMAITKRVPGYILKGILKGLKGGGELLFTGALFLFGELLILMPVLLEKLRKKMEEGLKKP